MTYEHVRVERVGPVGWLIFGRSERRDATDAAAGRLDRAWRALADDPAVRVIVNTGQDGTFLDADAGPADPSAWAPRVDKPVIAAVNGLCLGAGLDVVAGADLVVASADAVFGDAPRGRGGPAATLGLVTLLRKMPAEAVFRMAFLGEHGRLPAQRAYELGLVGEIVDPPERLRAAVQALGETVARNSPAALRASKRALWGAFEAGLSEACRAGAAHLVSLWAHPDQVEGPAAFAERREPRWLEPAVEAERSSARPVEATDA